MLLMLLLTAGQCTASGGLLPPGFTIPGPVKYIAPRDNCRTIPTHVPYCGGIATTASQAHVELVSYVASRPTEALALLPSESDGDAPVALQRGLCSEEDTGCIEDAVRLLCTSLNGWYTNSYAFENSLWAETIHGVPRRGVWSRLRGGGDLLGTSLRSRVVAVAMADDKWVVREGTGEYQLPDDAPSARYCADGYALNIHEVGTPCGWGGQNSNLNSF